MSTWRRKAIETCPDLQREFEQPDTTIYQVFFELLPRVREAHLRDDIEELQRIYGFAEWCFRQKAQELWNAAAVAFYEHLVDDPITFNQIANRLPPDVFEGCKSLFEYRLWPKEFKELCDRYAGRYEPPILYPCPACGSLVFDKPPGSLETCPICGWEDDIVQLGYPLMEEGANSLSLYGFQQMFMENGANKADSTEHVQGPGRSVSRDPEWRPFDPAHDLYLQWGLEADMKRLEAAGKNVSLYYWRKDYWPASKYLQ